MTGDPIECISAVTLETADMARAVRFYRAVGFELLYGGPDAEFTSFTAGVGYLNLQLREGFRSTGLWGRVIFWVADVDALHQRVRLAGLEPAAAPADAPWGERYFHLSDPDGHELSFARRI